jgi:hypothetical protein
LAGMMRLPIVGQRSILASMRSKSMLISQDGPADSQADVRIDILQMSPIEETVSDVDRP